MTDDVTNIINKLNAAEAGEDEVISILPEGWDVDRDYSEDGNIWGVRDRANTLHVLEWSETCGWDEADEEYLFVPDMDGEPLSEEEKATLCERAEQWLANQQCAGITWRVEEVGGLVDAVGTYQRRADGTWQILGHTVREPDAIRWLTNSAYVAACETLS